MAAIHASLAAGRWSELSLCEQLGNVGGEVHRALNARRAGNLGRAGMAIDRMLELLDLTLSDPRWRTGRKELARAREVLCDALLCDNEYGSTDESLTRYFDAFALAARRRRA